MINNMQRNRKYNNQSINQSHRSTFHFNVMSLCLQKREYECHIHYSRWEVRDILPDEIQEEEAIQAHVEKWLDQRWEEKEKALQHFIDHGEFTEEMLENRVEMQPSFTQFIHDIRFWSIPVLAVIVLGKGISSVVSGVGKFILQITV